MMLVYYLYHPYYYTHEKQFILAARAELRLLARTTTTKHATAHRIIVTQ